MKSFIVAALFIFVSSGAAISSQETELKSAKTFIEKVASDVINGIINTDKSRDTKIKELRVILTSNLDMDKISKLVLARNWNTATEAQKKEFSTVFTSVNVLTWVDRFEEFKGNTIDILNAEPSQKEGQYFVNSSILFAGEKTSIAWRVEKSANCFKIIDIVVQGVSMLQTYRTEYNSVIANSANGIDELITLLKNKEQELKLAPAKKTASNQK